MRVKRLTNRTAFASSLVLACCVTLGSWQFARAQSQPNDDQSGQGQRAESLNDSVYRITILAYYYNLYRPTRRYTATGILVKEPNLILTTRRSDPDYGDLFEDIERNGTVIGICESAPDPTRLAAQVRDLKDEKDLNERDKSRFDQITKQKGQNDKLVDKSASDRQKKYSEELAEQRNCVEATVRRVDSSRNLVLLEAKDKLRGGVPKFNVSDPRIGLDVTAYGFPTALDAIKTRRSTAAEKERSRYIPTITSGTVVKNEVDQKEGQIIFHQVPVSEGGWGGPLVNACGEVVGLNSMQNTVPVVRVDATTKVGDKRGTAEVTRVQMPTSSVIAARGARELKDFAELNGLQLSVNSESCVVRASFFDSKNMMTLAITGTALLLAAAAMIIAIRRPGPVRNTVARYFPGVARQTSYGRDYGGSGGGYGGYEAMPSNDPTAADYGGYGQRIETLPTTPPAATPRADTTAMMGEPQNVVARLVPRAGGATVLLDARRLSGPGYTIGREPDCEISTDNTTVSKRHAKITLAASGKLQVEDLNSANGTWRGKTRVQREEFSAGDIVRFGALEYKVELLAQGGGPIDSTLVIPPAKTWMLSGFDEDGRVVQWPLQPSLDGSGRQIETIWTIGRNSERSSNVLPDKRVSGEHARIRFTPQRGLEICDLASANGTKVDGKKISDSYVAIGEARTIDLGGCRLTLNAA